ncbi:MAG: aldehyde dehydrogenase family protein, partial [Myxococcales bacterium]
MRAGARPRRVRLGRLRPHQGPHQPPHPGNARLPHQRRGHASRRPRSSGGPRQAPGTRVVSDTIRTEIETTCRNARRSARQLSRLDDRARSDALRRTALRLRKETVRIPAANDEDLAAGREAGLTSALLDRLALTPERIDAMAGGLESVAALPDPLADSIAEWTAPAGLHIRQVRIPIGVIAVIYESRPNVTADVAALCVKSGNAVALKGGKEAIRSNTIIADLITEELTAAGIPPAAVQLIRSTDCEATWALLAQEEHVDVVIPRGGPGLVRAIAEHSKVTV